MPEVSRFYGIIIRMYFDDHAPPHFHAEYAEHEAVVDLEETRIIAGDLPARAFSLVKEWTALHQQELRTLWDNARHSRPLTKIEPLD